MVCTVASPRWWVSALAAASSQSGPLAEAVCLVSEDTLDMLANLINLFLLNQLI